MKNNILLTGASGFVGAALLAALLEQGAKVRCSFRTATVIDGAQSVLVPSIDDQTVWGSHLKGMDTVIHCAGRAHIMNDLFADPLPEFRRVNVGGTIRLAMQAQASGVRRFIYLSSVKVNGEQTARGQPFSETDRPMPQNPYAVSKYEAELALFELARQTGLEVVVIRPVLVYGCGVKANFFTMLRMVRLGMPLPFGSIDNQRSFISLDNLNSLIIRCIEHPKAANELFLASDGHDVSTTELLRSCGDAMGVSVYLLPVPQSWCTLSAALLGQGEAIQRLCGSLQVDISKARRLLDWEPPLSLQSGLLKTVKNFAP